MAPELIMQQRVTNLVDVYSFGCIVNEIMSEKVCYWDYKIINAGVVVLDGDTLRLVLPRCERGSSTDDSPRHATGYTIGLWTMSRGEGADFGLL